MVRLLAIGLPMVVRLPVAGLSTIGLLVFAGVLTCCGHLLGGGRLGEAIVASFEDLSFVMESSWQTPEVVKPSCGRLQKVCFEAGESDLLAVL
jgi:hypothetical protein